MKMTTATTMMTTKMSLLLRVLAQEGTFTSRVVAGGTRFMPNRVLGPHGPESVRQR